MSSDTATAENIGNVRRLSQKTSNPQRSIEYNMPPKRATTVHITSPASRHRRVMRPASRDELPDDGAYQPVHTQSPPFYQRKLRLQQQSSAINKTDPAANRADVDAVSMLPKPPVSSRSATKDKGDPFVAYNSDSSFSVESSLADDHSIRSLPTIRAGPSGYPLLPSAAALQNPAAAAAALAAANARPRSPEAYHRTKSLTTPKRIRPASVAVMTSTSTTITEDVNSRPRTPEKVETTLSAFPSPSPLRPRNIPSPVAAEETPSTPPSRVRRLSRRFSISSREFLISNTNSPSRIDAALPSFLELEENPQISAPAFPNPNQLASLHRRNSVNETLTPPRMRGRSNTAPKAAAGARRYVLFPDVMDGEISDLLEEEDMGAEEVPVVTAQSTPAPPLVEHVIVSDTTIETPPSPAPTKNKEAIQARLSNIRSLIASRVTSRAKGEEEETGEIRGSKCTIM